MEQPEQNQKQESLVGELQEQQLKGKRNTKILFGVVAVLIIGGIIGFWIYQKQFGSLNLSEIENQNDAETATTTQNIEATTTPVSNYSDAYEVQKCKNRLGPVVGKSGIVEWITPQKLPELRLFAPIDVSNASSTGGYQPQYQDFNYLVGHIKSGKYAGGDFIVSLVVPDGPSAGERYRLIRKDGKYYYLSKYSNSLPDPEWGVKFTVQLISDKTFDISDLNFPEKLVLGNPKAEFTYAASMGFFQNGSDFFCADYRVKAFTDSIVGDVYTDASLKASPDLKYYPKQGFYVKAPDGTERVYQLNIGIIGKDNVPLVTWTNGTQNTVEYNFQTIGGCGASNFRDIVNLNSDEILQVGKAFDGKSVYGYVNNNSQDLKDFYDQTYFPENTTKPSYTEFIASHPVFFWKDAFGMLVRFKNKKYLPLAECGKPVIYLYPEKTEKISVKVNPVGGMSYSDPEYGQGWNVISDPNSNITNLANNQIYPYLFWEGRGGIYETPKKGFVIRQDEVHEFLVTKLGQLGLNEKESADFIEYWEPKMQSSPYYFITFMDNGFMDSLAPLNIVPKPDTVIRILMDFLPLEKPIEVESFKIRTPQRKGFTVVEWGGVLR